MFSHHWYLSFIAVAAKAPRKQLGSASGAGSSSKTPSKKGSYSSGGGGNPLRVCDIPSWQKGEYSFSYYAD